MTSDQDYFERNSKLDAIRGILYSFEQAYQTESSKPEVRAFYQPNQNLGLALLRQLVVLNYDLSWESYYFGSASSPDTVQQEPKPAKIYRKAFPELDGDDELLLELLLLEIIYWENPEEEYYLESYPRFAAQLRPIFELQKKFSPEQFSEWKSSFFKSVRAQEAGILSSNLVVGDSEPKEEASQLPLENDATIVLNDSCRIVGETIGEGAFKRVYQGIQASTGRAVAVKQLMRLSKQNLRSFVSEGRAQAGLDHQNIPPIILLGDQDGQPTLLLEKLIRAPDWSLSIRDRNLRARNLDILLTVSRAAEYAHRECGLVHRDIKPQNVLVGEYREVYLVDWGLAVQVRDEPKMHESVRRLKDEPDSYIIGPAGYMAPEMAMGRNHFCTPATDVFMLGALLYEILSGHPPYDAYPRSACLRAAAHYFPDLPSDTPEELKAITLKAMANDPANRFSDGGQFADALERYLSHREAENQSDRAEIALQAINEAFKAPIEHRRPTPELLTSLIAVADQFRQAGDLWQSSLSDNAKEPSDKDLASGLSDSDSVQVSNPEIATAELERFSFSGIARSRQGECQAREKLVTFAIEVGDLALAESQANVLGNLHSTRADELRTMVQRALQQRKQDRLQRIFAATAALLMLVLSLVFWWQRTAAVIRADSLQAEKVAAEAQALAAQADKLRAEATTIAVEERERRIAAERLAKQSLILAANEADKQDFNQASVLFRAASFSPASVSSANAIIEVVEQEQKALCPFNTSTRNVPTGALKVSADGKWMASGDLFSAEVRIWSTENLTQAFKLTGHGSLKSRPSGGVWGSIRGLAFDPRNTNVLYSAGLDGTVRAWNLETRLEIRRFTPPEPLKPHDSDGSLTGDEILSLAIRPPQTNETALELAIGNHRGEILQLDADELRPIKKIDAHTKHVTALCYSHDGSQLASVSLDGQAKVWTKGLEPIQTLSHPDKAPDGSNVELLDVVFSPDDKYLSASGDAVTIPIWDTKNWSLYRSLAGHPKSEDGYNKIYDLFWETANHLLSAGADGVIRRWEPETGKSIGMLQGHKPNMNGRRGVMSLAVDSHGRLISAGRDTTIRVWDLNGNKLIYSLEGADIDESPLSVLRKPMHVAYAPGTDELFKVSSSIDHYIRRWNASTLRGIETTAEYQVPELQDGEESNPQGLAVSPDGSTFVVSFLTGQLIVWDTETPASRKTIRGHRVKIDSQGPPPFRAVPVAFDSHGTKFASLANDGIVKLWDAKNCELIRRWSMEDQEYPVPSEFSSDEQLRMTLEQQARLAEIAAILRCDTGLSFIGENLLVTYGRDNLARIWDTEKGVIVQRVDLGSQIRSIAFDPESHLLVLGGAMGDLWIGDVSDIQRIRLRSFVSLKPLMVPSRFGRQPTMGNQKLRERAISLQIDWSTQVYSVALSPGGSLMAVVLGDGSLTLVDVSMDEPEILGRAIGHTNPRDFYQMVQVLFTKQGRLLTVGDDRLIHHWEFDPWRKGRSQLSKSVDLQGGSLLLAAPQGNEWIYATGSGLARWPATAAPEPILWTPRDDLISSIATIPDSDELLISTNGGQAFRFSRKENKPVFSFPEDLDEKSDISERKVAVSQDGKLAALSLRSGQVEIWNLGEGTRLGATISPEGSPEDRFVEKIAFHPNGKQLAITDQSGRLSIWDLTNPSDPHLVFNGSGPQFAQGLEYLPDGSRLVMAGQSLNSESIVVFETMSFKKIASLMGHRPIQLYSSSKLMGEGRRIGTADVNVKGIDISPDGKLLASCGTDATVRIWKIFTNEANPDEDRYEPYAVLSTFDLERMATKVKLPDGSFLQGRQATWATSVTFRPDGRELAVSSEIGPVLIYDMNVIKEEFELPPEEIYKRVSERLGVQINKDRLQVIDRLFFVAPDIADEIE